MKKSCLLGIMVVLFVFILSACQFNTQNASQSGGLVSSKNAPAKLENPDISIMYWTDTANELFLLEAISKFEKTYRGKVTTTETPMGPAMTLLTTRLAAGDSFDVIYWNQRFMPQTVMNGLVQLPEQYLDLKDPIWAADEQVNKQFLWKGKQYAICGFVDPFVTFYNRSMFENNGLKTPLDYYNEGQWNWQNFHEVNMKLMQDLDRDGAIDQFGFSMSGEKIFILSLSNDIDVVKATPDGYYELTLKDPAMLETLQFYQDAFWKHKYFIIDSDGPKFKQGKTGMFLERIYHLDSIKEGLNDNWDFAPIPLGLSNKTGVFSSNVVFYGIMEGAKNPIGGAVFLQMRQQLRLSMSDMQLQNMGMNSDQMKRYNSIRKNVRVNLYQGLGELGKSMNPLLTAIRKGDSIVAKIDEHTPVLEEAIKAALQ